MALIDKLRAMRDADPQTDLLEFFGLSSGSQLHWDEKILTVGDETIPTAEAKRIIRGDSPHARTVTIGDL